MGTKKLAIMLTATVTAGFALFALSGAAAAGTGTPTINAVSAGSDQTCALTSGGGVWCWGSNYAGQLGDGTTTGSLVPVPVSGLSSGVTAISAGDGEACALTSSGAVECWGDNRWGQLGTGTSTGPNTCVDGSCSTVPVMVSGLSSGVTAISVGNAYACAVISGGGVKCWGQNARGELGDGTSTGPETCLGGGQACSTVPVAVNGLSSGVAAISAGFNYMCALNGGGVECWGDNSAATLGNGDPTGPETCGSGLQASACSTIPVAVSGLSSGVKAISLGGTDSLNKCALTGGGAVECWGSNYYLLGAGSSTPVGVTGFSGAVTAISAGYGHMCALIGGGGVECWGSNDEGEFGDGSTTDSSTPVASGLSSGVTAINAGTDYTCTLTSGAVECWGSNYAGQLGDGTTTDSSTPVSVKFYAGTSGATNCGGQTLSALSNEFNGDLAAAAQALGYDSVKAMHQAIKQYCSS